MSDDFDAFAKARPTDGPGVPPLPPGFEPFAPPPGERPRRRVASAVVGALAVAAVAAVAAARIDGGGHPAATGPSVPSAAPSGRTPTTLGPLWSPGTGTPEGISPSMLAASGVSTVEVDGVIGRLTVTAEPGGSISDQGGTIPLYYRLDSAAHTLHLSCAAGPACSSENYTVTIPMDFGLTMHQVSGQTFLDGISGPLDISASSGSTTATGLQVASFTAEITGGQLTAVFNTVPRAVRLTVVSSEATLDLPGSAAYTVVQHVVSGLLQIGVPQAADSPNTIDATISSGQIELATG